MTRAAAYRRADAEATMERIRPFRRIMANDLEQLEPFDAVSLLTLLLLDTLQRFNRSSERFAALGALASLIGALASLIGADPDA